MVMKRRWLGICFMVLILGVGSVSFLARIGLSLEMMPKGSAAKVQHPTQPRNAGVVNSSQAEAGKKRKDAGPLHQGTHICSNSTCRLPGKAPTVINIALISHGWDTAPGYHSDETIKGPKLSVEVTIQGILRVTNCPVHVLFVTGAKEEKRIRDFLTQLPAWRCDFSFEFVSLNETLLDEWMSAIGHQATHRTGRAGNIKFFYPNFFPGLDRVIMLDTDVLIGSDLCQLWHEFDHFSEAQLFSFAPQWKYLNIAKDNQFNAGVGLLHLQRMRDANWLQLARDAIRHWHLKGMKPRCCAHGDQSVFHMIRFLRPSAMPAPLSRWWNINKCHKYHGLNPNLIPLSSTDGSAAAEAEMNAPLLDSLPSVDNRVSSSEGSDTSPVVSTWIEHSEKDVKGKNPLMGTPQPGPGVFIGIVHLGCCRMCTKAKIGTRWAALFDEIRSVSLTEYKPTICSGIIKEQSKRG